MIEDSISGYLYDELFREINEEKCTAFQSMAWSLAQLLSKHFLSSLFLYILYFLFHKGKDTFAISQPKVQHVVYGFHIFLRFHKCFDNFHLSKNTPINMFFH